MNESIEAKLSVVQFEIVNNPKRKAIRRIAEPTKKYWKDNVTNLHRIYPGRIFIRKK